MKIYTKVVIDMATMQTEHEESFEYNGPLALCDFGGSSSSPSGGSDVDKDYNKRIATIAEAQHEMAEEMMGYYREHGLPLDVAMAESGLDLLPQQTALERGHLEAGIGLLPEQAGLAMDQIKSQRRLLPQQEQAKSQFLQDAQEGIDISGRMGMAQADVVKGFQGVQDQQRMSDRRMGLMPGSGAAQQRAQDLAISQAGSIAGARTQSRVMAEDQQFTRRQAAAGLGLGG